MATNPFATQTDDITVPTATEINAAGAALAGYVDIVAGGTYTPIVKITIAGDAGLEMGGTTRLKLASRSLTRALHGQPISNLAAADCFTPTTAGKWTAASANATCTLLIPINVPNGCTITGYAVTIDPAGAHGALPATMPQVTLQSLVVATDTAASHDTTVDTSANVAAYEPRHAITSGVVSLAVDNTARRYFLLLENEGGANAVLGLQYVGATVTFTVTSYDDAAA